jgi:hypothetical protein
MSKLIALRLPDDLAAKMETRCSIRKISQTAVLIEAIRHGWDEDGPGAVQPVRARSEAKPLNIPGVFMGSQLGAPLDEEPERAGCPMCSYTEYDNQTGDTYGCALAAHGPKIKHVRGVKL